MESSAQIAVMNQSEPDSIEGKEGGKEKSSEWRPHARADLSGREV